MARGRVAKPSGARLITCRSARNGRADALEDPDFAERPLDRPTLTLRHFDNYFNNTAIFLAGLCAPEFQGLLLFFGGTYFFEAGAGDADHAGLTLRPGGVALDVTIHKTKIVAAFFGF